MDSNSSPRLFLTVYIGGLKYAIPALDVSLIENQGETVKIPVFGSNHTSGILVGDIILPHVDVFELLGIETSATSKALHVKTGSIEFAISVDSVSEIITVLESDIKSIPPVFSKIEINQIMQKGITSDGEIIPVISVLKLDS